MGPEYAERVAVVSTNDCFHFGGSHGNFDYMGLSELHLHLEGTVDRETLMLLDPLLTQEEVDNCWSFNGFTGFLDCFKFIATRLRGPADYGLITRRMIESLGRQGVSYAEVTLGAGVVLWRGFDFDAVWQAIREAQCEAQKVWPVEVWWNLDAIRQFGVDHAMEVARLATNHAGDGVISFGIGGDERRGPALLLREAFRYAKDAGLRLTAHAGETDGADSIRAALSVGAERIGHGIRAVEDPDLIRRLREERIPLEVCITSNVKTGAVSSLDAHPVRRLFDAGVPITLSTDDPGIFETDLAREFALARDVFGFSEAELGEVVASAETFRFARPGKGISGHELTRMNTN
jgi:aminodeoxyfutalosine deaminase